MTPVEAGQRLLAIEAMKMENEVRAARAGTVESVAVAVGQTVELGAELVVIGYGASRTVRAYRAALADDRHEP